MAQVTERTRTINLKEFIAAGGFGPVMINGRPADDLPGYTIKQIVNDPRTKHLINIVNVDPGMGKYKHYHYGAETVMVILEGQGEFLYNETDSRPIKVGDLCHSYPGEIHGTRNTGDVPLRYLVVEGPLPLQMQKDIENTKPLAGDRNRIIHLEEFIAAGGFGPIMRGDQPADDLPGYTVKFIAQPGDPQGKHLVNIVNVEPGFKKYNHWHNNAETVLYFLQGEGEYVVDENNTVPIKAGDLAHSFPGEVHGTRN
ncbi:MAG TPA: cupin domain-containing protein, partial [Dehalococcoidia bacterium]|nr:cupin domain-containing protein [Dehalococcoidia bacterium]